MNEITGPSKSYFELPPIIPAKELGVVHYVADPGRYVYQSYAIGMVGSREETKGPLTAKMGDVIRESYCSTKYRKPSGYCVNFGEDDPLIVWRQRPEIIQYVDDWDGKGPEKWAIKCRFVCVPPQEVEKVRQYLEEEKDGSN